MAEIKSNIVDLEVVYNKLNATIDKNINLLKEGATAVDAYNKKISVVPSEFQKSLTDIKNKMDSVSVSTKKLEQTEKQLQQARLKELQLAKQREQAFDKYDKQLAREQAKLQSAQNLYNKTQQQLNKVQQAYNNLAVKKERYNNLSAYEEGRLKTLQSLTEKYNTTLKAVDATVGKHSRNVGNYASAFNPLSNSIDQLTREMPAFANSVQTGFMAISNNLPIFFDSMQQAIAQQKELQAQGQPSKNALQLLVGGLFTLGTALSVGVTLLTVYGAQVVEFISGSKKKKEAIEQEKKALEEKNKAEDQARETTASFQSSELSRSKILFENAKNLTLSYKERKDAINELRERYPEYLKGLSDEQILAGNTADAENALNDALIKRGVALAAQEMLQKNLTDELKLRLKNSQLLKQSLEDQKAIIEQGNEIVIYTDKQKAAEQQKEALARKSRKAQYDAYVQQILALRDERQAIIATYNENSKYLGAVNETTEATKKNTKAKEKNAKGQLYSKEWFDRMIGGLEAEQRLVASMSPAYDILGRQIRLLKIAYEELYGTKKKVNEETEKEFEFNDEKLRKAFENIGKDAKKSAEDFLKMLADYKQGFIDTFADQSGFSGLLGIISGDLEKFQGDAISTALAVSEAFQQAFNTISEASQANFDAEYERLEKQRDFAIEMAGGSATAREEIDRQYEERKKSIQRREAEAQKRLAIFNIVTNTAQAILATYAKVGFPVGIPLAIAMGAIGAFQVGMVASQEIPQFWKGTENAPEGLAWTQEKGAEVITDKSGNIKTLGSDKGAQLTYLSKGDKVYKSHEDYINKVLSKNGISDLGSYINFAPQKEVNNSFDMAEMKQEFSKLASVIKNKDGVNISIDEKGFRKKQGNTEFINSRLNLKSRQV